MIRYARHRVLPDRQTDGRWDRAKVFEFEIKKIISN